MRAKSTPQSRQRQRNRQRMRENFTVRQRYDWGTQSEEHGRWLCVRAPHEGIKSAIKRTAAHLWNQQQVTQ